MAASSRSSSGGSSLPDPYADAWERVAEAVLESPGSLQAYVRRAIERGEDPPELAPLLAKVRAHAYRIVASRDPAADVRGKRSPGLEHRSGDAFPRAGVRIRSRVGA